MSSRRPPIVRSKSLSIAIDGCSPGAVIDAQGMHNMWRLGFDAQALDSLSVYLESRDAANELPDGSLA